MDKIESFKVDHTRLGRGLYVSRKDEREGVCVTTFDLRFREPNKEPVMDTPAIHTIEHIGATYLRNSKRKEDVVYFGPMGCRTGFYLVMFGDLRSRDVLALVKDMLKFTVGFDGEIPGASAAECGNYLEQNLPMAKYYAKQYLFSLENEERLDY